MKPIKVIHVASGDLWAGAEAQLYTLAKTQADSTEVDVEVALMNEGTLAEKLRLHGISVAVFDEQIQSAPAIVKGLMRLFKQARPDVVHTHRQKENILASIANSLSVNTVSVRTQHGATEFNHSPWRLHKHLQRFLDWFCGRYLQEKIIAVSDELAEKLSKGFPHELIVTIENGVDVDEVLRHADGIPEFKRLTPDHYHIGIVGRLVPVKRVDLFLQSAQKILQTSSLEKPIHFHVIGEGPLHDTLESQSQNLGIAEQVTFHGHRSDIAQYIANLDILLMCSDHEGLPMTALEALAVNTPIVSYNIGAMKPYFLKQQGGVLAGGHSADAYCEAICELLKN